MRANHETSIATNGGKPAQADNPKRRPTRGKPVRPLAPKQFIDIIEHINDGLVVLDKDWHYVYVNQKAAVMLQREKPGDLIGKHIWTEYPDGVGQPFHLAYEKAMKEQTPLVFEDHYEPWDLWFENRIYPFPDRLLILFTDITERKQVQRLIDERQHFVQTVLDTEPGTVYIYDIVERRNVYVNRFWPRTFGYTEEETQGMGEDLLGRIVHPDDIPRITAHHQNWREAGGDEMRSIEYQIRTKSGEWRWLHSREVPFLREVTGRVKHILGITHDITERKRAEQAQVSSEAELRALFAAINDAVLVIDCNGVYRKIAPTNSNLLYKPPEELLGKTLWDIFPVEQAEAFIKTIRQVVETQQTTHIEYKLLIQGRDVWFDTAISPMGADTTLWMARDITDRKRMEEALRESEKRYQLISTVASDYMFSSRLDADGRLTLNWVAGAFESITGYSLEEYVAHGGWRSTLHPDDLVIDDLDMEKLRANKPVISEVRTLMKNGNLVWVRVYAQPVLDVENKQLVGIYGAVQDITDRKQAEERLRQLNEELEERIAARTEELAAAMIQAQEADRLKSVFLATMSHELRTPLNSIIGFTGVILQGLAGPLNEEQTRQLNMIRDSARHLLALINDVLDISKIEAGQLEILRRPFDMRQAIDSVLRVMQPLAQKKNLPLVTWIGPGVGTLHNDRRRVEQVLINLVSNSIKFTARGEIRIQCQVKDGWLETSVHDEGIGIKLEDMGKLFKPFQQIDTGLARGHEGTGLGLAICKRLVSAMGGEIMAESEWGAGSTFKFTLPL